MAYDADGNFYNPYSPGSYEYEMEEGTRGQEPGTGGVVTVAQTPDILRVQQAAPPPGFNTFNQVTAIILSVATLAVPGLEEMIGASILEGLGVTGATAAVEAGVGAAALSAGSTAAQGGSVEDVLKSAATAGFASGINVGMGGGVAGAATGSFVGSAIQGGGVDQVLTNAIAAGAGAGVQGVLGPAAGTIVRDLIKTGEVSDRTLINAAVAEIGAFNKPGDRQAPIVEGQPIAPPAAEETAAREIEAVTQSDAARQQELADYQEKLNQYAIDKAIYEQTYGPIDAQPPAAAPATAPAAEATLSPQTVTAPAPVVSPVVTDLDLVKQVAAQQTTTVDPQTLERVIVQGQGANVANVAPVETAVTTPVQQEVPGGTALSPVEVLGTTEKLPEPGFEEYQPLPEEKVSEVETDVSVGPQELEQVTVTPLPSAPVEPEAKVEEPKKEEPKKEEPKKEPNKLYPTVTSVPPPKRPGRQPIITGASPARLLADALAAYRPAGAIEGEESGKERQNVWNEKSLRLKDALGL